MTAPLTAIVEARVCAAPRVERVSAPTVRARLDAEVSRIVDPVALAVEFWIVNVPPMRRPFVAIVYVRPPTTLASRVRLLNSFVLLANAAKVSVPLAASLRVTELAPADHEEDVELFVHVPFTVQLELAMVTTVVAPRTTTFPVTAIADPRASRVPWIVTLPFTRSE